MAKSQGYDHRILLITRQYNDNPNFVEFLDKYHKDFSLIISLEDLNYPNVIQFNRTETKETDAKKSTYKFLSFLNNHEDEFYHAVEFLFPELENFDLTPFLKDIKEVTTPSRLGDIDCIYVINLNERRERWDRMATLLNYHNLRATRFEAINGWSLREDEDLRNNTLFGAKCTNSPKTYLTWGGIGLYLSQLSILKDAYERGFKKIWIMEDDVLFRSKPKVLKRIMKILDKDDPDWGILYTDINNNDAVGNYHTTVNPLIPPPNLKNRGKSYYKHYIKSKLYREIRYRGGGYSIIFKQDAIKKIYESLVHTPITIPYDDVIHYVEGIKRYALNKNCITHVFGDIYFSSDTNAPIN